jgi:anthranilate phosphoribosyltransferase
VVVLNAAYALHASDAFDDIDDCVKAANESIESGAALDKLESLADVSQNVPTA